MRSRVSTASADPYAIVGRTAADRREDSRSKIAPPFELDPTLCFYSPQDNVDAFAHPRVAAHLDWVASAWQPPPGGPRIALLLPCTKHKPYVLSAEHRAVNTALAAAGWETSGAGQPPSELREATGFDDELLDVGPLQRRGVWLDRIVISEPLALVPYTAVYERDGEPSVATAYDDPGLFESRGTSVAPWREDCTATPTRSGRWRWGPAERLAYATAHNHLSGVIGSVLSRVADRYHAILGWVSPGLTHRSFLVGADQRQAEGLSRTRRGPDGPVNLRGVGDDHPGLVEVLPSAEQAAAAREALADRLRSEGRSATTSTVNGVYARGDGNDTPLGLPELLSHLVATLDVRATAAAAASKGRGS
jgi:hypothetical protein